MAENQEIRWALAVAHFLQHHSLSQLLKPLPPYAQSHLPEKLFWGPTVVSEEQRRWYQNQVAQTHLLYPYLYKNFSHIPKLENLITRYHLLQLLSNISLSVAPEIKKRWKIDHELFGAFYNTSTSYCSLFPDLEPGSKGNATTYTPPLSTKLNILVNPPYTSSWIRWSIQTILKWHLTTPHTFYLVIPIWDKEGRKKAKLSTQPYDMPEISQALQKSSTHYITHLPFFDGIIQKPSRLKDPVYVIIFQKK